MRPLFFSPLPRRTTLLLAGVVLTFTPPLRGQHPTTPTILPNGRYVVVDLSHNELRLLSNGQVLWRTPAGTGTGIEIRDARGHWAFETTPGQYQIQYKERNPVWNRPDWWYLEHQQPLPPTDSPERSSTGDLGEAALYLGQELAIHGTQHPELLGKRVSHGCIRISNSAIIRLYHNVQVGTPVLITGIPTGPIDTRSPSRPGPAGPTSRTQPLPSRSVSPSALATAVHLQSTLSFSSSWTQAADTLVEQAVSGDTTAARLLVALGPQVPSTTADEYGAFLLDAFLRAPKVFDRVLGRSPPSLQAWYAATLVNTALTLYHDSLSPQAPWPSERLANVTGSPLRNLLLRTETRYRALNNVAPLQP